MNKSLEMQMRFISFLGHDVASNSFNVIQTSIQQLIANTLIMMSIVELQHSRLTAFLAVNQTEIHLKYPNTAYIR